MKGESYRVRVKVTVAGCDVHQCTIDSIVDKHLRDLIDEIEPEDLEHECHAAIVVYERDSRAMMKLIEFLKKYENGRSFNILKDEIIMYFINEFYYRSNEYKSVAVCDIQDVEGKCRGRHYDIS